MSVLENAQMLAKSTFDREHVTPYIKDNITKDKPMNSQDQSAFRLTLDEPNDLQLLIDIFEYFSPKLDFSYVDVIDYLSLKPENKSE